MSWVRGPAFPWAKRYEGPHRIQAEGPCDEPVIGAMLAAMFIRYFVDVPLAYDDAERALTGAPNSWVPEVAEGAQDRGELLLSEVGFGGRAIRLEREVEISVGTPMLFASRMILPLSWKVTSKEGLFPSLEADLELAPLGRSRTQLAINANYRPPMGLVGRTLDRALLHRVAEATVKDFLDRVAERLTPSHRESPPAATGRG